MPSFDNAYAQQLALLVDVLPHVDAEKDFALKGGTAINLFFRDLPRLSVDIDLAWLPLGERPDALRGIAQALGRIGTRLREDLGCTVQAKTTTDGTPTGLAIVRKRVPIKIDVTPVLRGSVFPPERRGMRPAAVDRFGLLEVQTLGFADLFAGKLVAALDRQHPRDLFDVMHLLAEEGITDALWSAFLVYLTATGRPAAELIDPNRLALEASFVEQFEGMTEQTVDAAMLVDVREALIAGMQARVDDNVRAFFLSVERGAPEWERLDLPPHVSELPAIRWKLLNLARRSPEKRDADLRQLTQALDRIRRNERA